MEKISVSNYVISQFIAMDIKGEALEDTKALLFYLGLNTIEFEDFEMYFPEISQDFTKLLTFISQEDNFPLIIKTVNYHHRIERNYRRHKPQNNLLSDEYDDNDYELSQKITDIGFHM